MARKGHNALTWLAVGLLIVIIGGVSVIAIQRYFLIPVGAGGDVQVRVQILNGLDDTVWTPADAAVSMYNAGAMSSMPSSDIEPMDLISAMTESPDGTFTSTSYAKENSWVYIYISAGTNFYVGGFFRKVPAVLWQGITNIAVVEVIKAQPNGGPAATDVGMYITSGGARISNATSIVSGAQEWKIDLSATSTLTWGSAGYVDPETGYFYEPSFLTMTLNRSTNGRMIVDSSAVIAHFVVGDFEYWVLDFGSIPNDADTPLDGTKTVYASINNLAAGTNALDFGIYWGGQRLSQITAGSFGTSYLASADAGLDLDLA